MYQIIFFLTFIFVLQLHSDENKSEIVKNSLNKLDYTYNPEVPREIWNDVEKYFLPKDHPIKDKLDTIFKKSRATKNKNTLDEAHFIHVKEGIYTDTICARHSKLEGYVIKFFYDDGPSKVDWLHWVKRVEGAKAVRDVIQANHGYDKIFKVPQKWIYPLPQTPIPKGSPNHYHFILVAEDMNVWRRKDNFRKWKTTSVTPLKLQALYKVIKEAGMSDSVYAFNIPFAKDGRITFIDTEHHHTWPIHYERLNTYLSPRMNLYWQQLTQK